MNPEPVKEVEAKNEHVGTLPTSKMSKSRKWWDPQRADSWRRGEGGNEAQGLPALGRRRESSKVG